MFYFTEGDIEKRDSKVFLQFSMLSDILLMIVIFVAVFRVTLYFKRTTLLFVLHLTVKKGP